MSRLLLIEDDLSLGATLHERLIKEGYQTDWAQSAVEARDVFVRSDYDLIVLDVGLPDGTGFDLAAWLKAKSSVPFIFVTAMSSAEYRLKGFELGAEEYIPKPFHLKELLLRVRHVLENHSIKRHLRIGEAVVDFRSHLITRSDGSEFRVTPRDLEVLRLLSDRSPEVVSRDDILNQIWGVDKFPSERTVDNCIVRLRQALGDETSEIIRSVRGVGYQLYMKEEK